MQPNVDTSHKLPPLPYAERALQPAISKETLAYHYGRHHRGYVQTMNDLLEHSPLRGLSLEELIRKAEGKLFNSAAQAWNHSFYWRCLTPERGLSPRGALDTAIRREFGSPDAMLQAFRDSALGKFGSGWTWLVLRPEGSLAIENTSDADTPLRTGKTPLLVCDVWEHAYYLDYRNNRARYVDAMLEIVNWAFVGENFAAARKTDSRAAPRLAAQPAAALNPAAAS